MNSSAFYFSKGAFDSFALGTNPFCHFCSPNMHIPMDPGSIKYPIQENLLIISAIFRRNMTFSCADCEFVVRYMESS